MSLIVKRLVKFAFPFFRVRIFLCPAEKGGTKAHEIWEMLSLTNKEIEYVKHQFRRKNNN